MPFYTVCPDDGIVAGNDAQHQVFHGRLALQIAQLTALTQAVTDLSQSVASLSGRVAALESANEEPA